MRMAGAGSLPLFLGAVIVTHLHSDHVCALNDVITTHWIMTQGNTTLKIFGPPGTAQFVERQLFAFEPDIGYRIAHHEELTDGPNVEVTELDPGDSFMVNNVAVTTAATMHAPVSVARSMIASGLASEARHRASARMRRPPASVLRTSIVLPLR